MRILLILCVLASTLSSVAAATLPACTPSRACALERAKQAVLQQIAPNPGIGRNTSVPSRDAVKLLSTLMRSDAQEYRSGFTRTVLTQLAANGQQALLQDVARELIAKQRDAVALQALIDIRELPERDSLYQEIAVGHARGSRFELAYWAAGRMQASSDRDALLLFIAERQLQAGEGEAAAQTATALGERARDQSSRDESLRIQAVAAAQRGDPRRALELANQIAMPVPFGRAMQSIAELQIQRNSRSDALATVRFHREQLQRRGLTSSAESQIAERLAQLDATSEALRLVSGAQAEQASVLAAIARGAALAERFDEALALLDKIPAEQRPTVRTTALFMAQQRAVHGIDFGTAFDAANAFSPIPPKERSRWVRETVLLLGRMNDLPRARDGLNYELDKVQQDPESDLECGENCPPNAATPDPAQPCRLGFREEALCNVALLQARLGFIEDAERTSNLLRSDQAVIGTLLAIAKAQITAGRTALVRRTFARSLALARLISNNAFLDSVIKAYANWVATAPLYFDALTELNSATRELLRFDTGAACRVEGAPLAVAAAYASAGLFATAFALVETQLQCQQVNAYLAIYERGR